MGISETTQFQLVHHYVTQKAIRIAGF